MAQDNSSSEQAPSDRAQGTPTPASGPSSREDLGGAAREELDALVARLERHLAPLVRQQEREKLKETRTVRFPEHTMALITRLATRFGVSDSEIIRLLCTGHRLEFEEANRAVDALYRTVERFAGAFETGTSGAETSGAETSGASDSRQRHLAEEMLRQVRAIYDAFQKGDPLEEKW